MWLLWFYVMSIFLFMMLFSNEFFLELHARDFYALWEKVMQNSQNFLSQSFTWSLHFAIVQKSFFIHYRPYILIMYRKKISICSSKKNTYSLTQKPHLVFFHSMRTSGFFTNQKVVNFDMNIWIVALKYCSGMHCGK